MADTGNKENSTKKPAPQFKMIRDPNHVDKTGQKSRGSMGTKSEVSQLRKIVLHLNAKADKLDQKLDRILELLTTQNPKLPVQLPATSKDSVKGPNVPIKSNAVFHLNNKRKETERNDVMILESPKSNRNQQIDHPQLTSTPQHKFAFPATPVQHNLTPIERANDINNVINSMESPMKNMHFKKAASSQKKRRESKSHLNAKNEEPAQLAEPLEVVEPLQIEEEIKQEEVTEQKEEEIKQEETPFKAPKQKAKTPALELKVNDSAELNYNPQLIMINSRSRARRQKQSAALKCSSPVQSTTTNQTDVREQTQENALPVDVPTNEPTPMQVETKPVDVTPKCEPATVPVLQSGRHDYSITNSTDSEETANFLNVVASTKSTKVSPPVIMLDKSKTPVVAPTELNAPPESNTVASELVAEVPRQSLSVEKEVFTTPATSHRSDIKANKLMSTNKSSFQTSKPVNVSMASIKQEQSEITNPSQIDASRPRRRVAPVSLKEPPLNKKMRR